MVRTLFKISQFHNARSGLVSIVALLLLLNLPLGAQTSTGTIRGTVYDMTGGIIPGAVVTAVEEARGVERNASTSGSGEYVFTHVEPGVYTMTFTAENFAPFNVEGLDVRVGEPLLAGGVRDS